MKRFAIFLIAFMLPLSGEEGPPAKLPEFWQTIVPSPYVETQYLRKALEPRRSAIFRDLGTIPMQQSPYHGHSTIDNSSTLWSSDLQIYDFFLQSQIALQTLHFNF